MGPRVGRVRPSGRGRRERGGEGGLGQQAQEVHPRAFAAFAPNCCNRAVQGCFATFHAATHAAHIVRSSKLSGWRRSTRKRFPAAALAWSGLALACPGLGLPCQGRAIRRARQWRRRSKRHATDGRDLAPLPPPPPPPTHRQRCSCGCSSPCPSSPPPQRPGPAAGRGSPGVVVEWQWQGRGYQASGGITCELMQMAFGFACNCM